MFLEKGKNGMDSSVLGERCKIAFIDFNFLFTFCNEINFTTFRISLDIFLYSAEKFVMSYCETC